MKVSDFHIRNHEKLDHYLYKLCKELMFAKKVDPDLYGWVAAAVLDPRNRFIWAINIPAEDGDRIHAERAAITKYNDTYGDIPKGSIILTTLSPCNEFMNDREGDSCTDLINDSIVRKVYCGFIDPTQQQDNKRFALQQTKNDKIVDMCKKFASNFIPVDEGLTEYKETKPVTIHTNPYYRGATIGAGVKEQLPVTKMPIEELQMWESDKTLRTKKVRDWVKNTLIPKLQDKGKLNPMIVWNRKGKHFVIDGNHRFLAYKAVGFKGPVPVKIVPQEMIAINNKVLEPVDENFADGKGPGRPGDSQRHGIPKHATKAELEKASHSKGRKGQLARWQINMRNGKKK